MRRYATTSTLGVYEFNLSLFDHDNPEDFLLFLRKLNTNIAVAGMLGMDAKIQYLRTLVRGEALRQFDLLYADI